MIGYDDNEIYVAMCGEPCSSWKAGREHEQSCWRCAQVRSEDFDGSPLEHEENDADDRGICYEDD